MEYRVVYKIDVDADSPLDAARQAYECMIDPESMPPILGVAPIVDNLPDWVSAVDVDLSKEGI